MYLPFLSRPGLVSTVIAELLHSALSCWDSPSPRNVITEWLPLNEREAKSPATILRNRGWETAGRTEPAGSWVSDRLLRLLADGNTKVRHVPVCLMIIYTVLLTQGHFGKQAEEAALQALGALANDNSNLATALTRASSEKNSEKLFFG